MCWAGWVSAEVAVPPLSARVTDLTTTLTADQKAGLEQTLRDFETKKGSQIAVLILPSTAPETIEQYSLRVLEKWKLGRKKVDDGAFLLVAKEDKAIRIEVGYGLEGALNDAMSKRIIGEVITPKFKQGDFYGGVKGGIDSMISVIQGEPLPEPQSSMSGMQTKELKLDSLDAYIPIIFVVALLVGNVLRLLVGRLWAAVVTGGVTVLLSWMLAGGFLVALISGVLVLLFTLFGSRIRGLGGRGRGGGFGGGGGGFGGGGASGRW